MPALRRFSRQRAHGFLAIGIHFPPQNFTLGGDKPGQQTRPIFHVVRRQQFVAPQINVRSTNQLFAFRRDADFISQAAELTALLQVFTVTARAGQRRVSHVQQHLESLLLIKAVELMTTAHGESLSCAGEGYLVAEWG